MNDPTTLGYEPEPADVAAEVAAVLDGWDDPVARYARATAAQTHHQAVVEALAAERARIAAELWNGGTGLSYAKIAETLKLGSRARAQQLVERGRARQDTGNSPTYAQKATPPLRRGPVDIERADHLADAATTGLSDAINAATVAHGLPPLVWSIREMSHGVLSEIAGHADSGTYNEPQVRQIVQAYATAFGGTEPRETRSTATGETVTELETTFTLGPVKATVWGIVEH